MKHYNNDQVDIKIQAFLSKKLQKYPELSQPTTKKAGSANARYATKFIQSLTSRTRVVSQ